MVWSGGCLCGRVRFETSEKPKIVGHCHCRSCQRHSGSAFMTFAIFQSGDVTWRAGKPQAFSSSSGVVREFCGNCGSSLTFGRTEFDELSIASGVFDDPGVLKPELHVFCSQRCEWIHMSDGLPTHDRFPPGEESREP